MITTRAEYISAQASEKIVLAQIHATHRLINWTLDSGAIYVKSVDHYSVLLKQEQTDLTEVATYGALVEGTFFYDSETSELYVWCTGSVDPSQVQMIVTYRFFYSNAPVTATHDLDPAGVDVLYLARIRSNPGYKHKVGVEQALTSLIGTGDLILENNDGALDEIFDKYYFENQLVEIYSIHRDLDLSEKKKIYKGRVTNKAYDGQQVKFTVKDQIYDLEQPVQQDLYSTEFNVEESVQKQYKRVVYGKVEGLRLQSINQIQDGYTITGTASATSDSVILTGTGTAFLTEVSPGDTITVNEEEYNIESVESDVLLTLDNEVEFGFSGKEMTLLPEIPTTLYNRTFMVAGHACSRVEKTITSVVQLNRVELNSVTGLYVGDFLEFESGERIAIKNFNGNIVILRQNLIVQPEVAESVFRQPIESVYVRNKEVLSESYTITNSGAPDNFLKITLNDDAEFQLARTKSISEPLAFTNGSRLVTTSGTKDLTTLIKPRDFIRPNDINYTAFYEVLQVEESQLYLREAFADPNFTGDSEGKFPDYIDDDTIVSATVYGKTVDGTPTGTWIKSGSQAVKDIISGIDILNINDTSFSDADATANQTISLALPRSFNGGLTKSKDAIDLIGKSIFASLTLDNNLDLQYRVLQNAVPSTPVVVRDSDVIDWKINTTNGKSFRNIVLNYRHKDIDYRTSESSNLIQTHSSDFVRDYIGTDNTSEYSAYLYEETDARIMAHRVVYFNRLGRSDLTIRTDLRLEGIEIGDTIQLEFDRLYKRLGDNVRKKLMVVIGLTKNGESLTIEATDFSNTFNSTAVITPNTAPDYIDATANEKLRYGYITDARGIVNDEESTSNINLIS